MFAFCVPFCRFPDTLPEATRLGWQRSKSTTLLLFFGYMPGAWALPVWMLFELAQLETEKCALGDAHVIFMAGRI